MERSDMEAICRKRVRWIRTAGIEALRVRRSIDRALLHRIAFRVDLPLLVASSSVRKDRNAPVLLICGSGVPTVAPGAVPGDSQARHLPAPDPRVSPHDSLRRTQA